MAIVPAVALVSALLGLMQLAAGADALRLFRTTSEAAPVGLLANRNHQAALLACALPIAALFAASRMRLGHRPELVLPALAAAAALLLGSLAATGSRMGLMLGAVGLAGGAWCWSGARLPIVPQTPGGRLRLAAAFLAICVVVSTTAWRGGAIERLAQTDFAEESRSASFAPMLQTARAFSPLGAGFGSFDTVYRRFEPDQLLLHHLPERGAQRAGAARHRRRGPGARATWRVPGVVGVRGNEGPATT